MTVTTNEFIERESKLDFLVFVVFCTVKDFAEHAKSVIKDKTMYEVMYILCADLRHMQLCFTICKIVIQIDALNVTKNETTHKRVS